MDIQSLYATVNHKFVYISQRNGLIICKMTENARREISILRHDLKIGMKSGHSAGDWWQCANRVNAAVTVEAGRGTRGLLGRSYFH